MLNSEMEKPAALPATGFQMIDLLPGKFDWSDDSEMIARLQAARILKRFPMSVPLALVTARLAYGGRA